MKKRRGEMTKWSVDKGLAGRGSISLSPRFPISPSQNAGGFTLIELVITVTVLAILTLGVVPLVQVSVKRQKELQLREALRQMREAIDQFHREALAAPPMAATGIGPNGQPNPPGPPVQPGSVDPRIRVYISDQTIFSADNPERYPPDLETLKKGVNVVPIATAGLPGGAGNPNVNATSVGNPDLSTKTKFYLREIPIDPITGKAEWDFRSCYQAPNDTSWDRFNVFNVHSKSTETSLDGKTKYSDW